MATEKANYDQTVDTQNYHTQENSTERSASSQGSAKFHFSKALAHRAVYGSSSRRSTGSRKVRSTDARTLPSRLSKVSLADDDSEN
ncbi:Uncharacterized protein TCM_004762 [Theobroma cacao]|uniref:Uncharacterized protein n=1 Tax=Theobroma cacao TaxID=3641 RepID=A0A061DT23_THECC|nr:Uncharacterized protein TCM_004762 [Theobroma cacao]